MSETIVVAEDPIINFTQPSSFAVPQGPLFVNYQTFLSQSQSATSIQIDCPPPNPYVTIDPVVYAVIPVCMVIAGQNSFTNPSLPLIRYGVDTAFRALPFQSNLSNLNVQLNNTTINQTQYDLYPDLLRLGINPYEQYKKFGNLFPSYLDTCQSYTETINTLYHPLGGNKYKTTGNYPRGLFPAQVTNYNYTPATTNPAAAAIVAYTIIQAIIIEPIFLSPFLFGDMVGPGFIQINKLAFTFNFVTNWLRMLSFAYPQNINYANPQLFIGCNPTNALIPGTSTALAIPALSTAFTKFTSISMANMMIRFLTLPVGIPVPIGMKYPLLRINTYNYRINGTDPAAPGAIFQGYFNNTNFKYMPDGVVIYARCSNQYRMPDSTDTYARIRGINIQWNNQTGILANASPQQLYRMTEENGVDLSWTEYYGMENNQNTFGAALPPSFSGVGSYLYLKFGKDIPLLPGEIITQDGNWNLQFNIDLQNLNPNTAGTTFDLYVLTLNTGIINIHNNQAEMYLGLLKRDDALRLDSAPRIPSHEYKNLKGGNFLSTIGSIARLGAKAAPYIAKGLEAVADFTGSGLQFGGRKRKRITYN